LLFPSFVSFSFLVCSFILLSFSHHFHSPLILYLWLSLYCQPTRNLFSHSFSFTLTFTQTLRWFIPHTLSSYCRSRPTLPLHFSLHSFNTHIPWRIHSFHPFTWSALTPFILFLTPLHTPVFYRRDLDTSSFTLFFFFLFSPHSFTTTNNNDNSHNRPWQQHLRYTTILLRYNSNSLFFYSHRTQ
jgi:hypothetical protein